MQPGAEELLTGARAQAGAALMREVLERFGSARLRAFGGSMRPAIEPGDVLHVTRASASRIEPGAVVLVERDGRLFAHRLVARDAGARVITRGDAHRHHDPAVPDADVLGVVTHVVRGKRTRSWRRILRAFSPNRG